MNMHSLLMKHEIGKKNHHLNSNVDAHTHGRHNPQLGQAMPIAKVPVAPKESCCQCI